MLSVCGNGPDQLGLSEMLSGVPSGCRAGLGLNRASLVVSSSSDGEAGLALGTQEMRGWEDQDGTTSHQLPQQVRHPEKKKKKKLGERLPVIGDKEAFLCGAQENSRACSCFMAESRERNIITGWQGD